MIEFDDFHTPRGVRNDNLSNIKFSEEANIKLKLWDSFVNTTTEVIYLMSEQTSVAAAKIIGFKWYTSCIKLGKEYYFIKETTDQIYNNLQMLYDDVDIANFVGIKRTFITTFTNVARYQREGDTDVD